MARNKSEKVNAALVEVCEPWVAWREAERARNHLDIETHRKEYLRFKVKMTDDLYSAWLSISVREIYALAGVPYHGEE